MRWIALLVCASVVVYGIEGGSFPGALTTVLKEQYKSLNQDFPFLFNALVAAAITATVAWVALRTTAAVNIRNKRMDVILHCNIRYDDLYKLRLEIKKEPNPHTKQRLAESYFKRYWGLQSDQIDYWLAGYVDPETMASWIFSLASSLDGKTIGDHEDQVGSVVEGESYLGNWEKEKGARDSHRIVNQRLSDTVSFLTEFFISHPQQVSADEKAFPPEEIQRRKDSRRRRIYASILQYLRIVESNERSIIQRLSRNTHHRMGVDDLALTAELELWKSYLRLDTRRLPFRWGFKIVASVTRFLSGPSNYTQIKKMDRLRRRLEKEFPKPSNARSEEFRAA